MIGIVAGEGLLPELLLKGAQKQGQKVFVLGIHGITNPRIVEMTDHSSFLHLIEVGKAIRTFLKAGVTEVAMVGRIQHKNVFSIPLWKLGFSAIKVWWRAPDWRADSILGALCSVFEDKGLQIMSSTRYMEDHLAQEGLLSGKAPSKRIQQDIEFGKKLARGLGAHDVGQTVVVKNKAVVAVEAMEGTDACILRAGKIAGPGCVVVKLAKPSQDMRFDVPVVGETTFRNLKKAGIACLAVEAEKTLLLCPELLGSPEYKEITIVGI